MDKEDLVCMCLCIHKPEYYLAMIKKEIEPFATTWMKLEDIVLSGVSQTKTNTVFYHLYVESEKV